MTTLMGLHTSLKTETNVPIPMRDGALLYADIYRPDSPDRVPVLLQRVPYNKSMPAYRSVALDSTRAASHGFAVVIQDTRGRYTSDGEFYPFLNEAQDGYDTIEWCAAQPWSTGKVGMFGRSYAGATQWLAATSRPPSLAAIVPGVTASDYYEGWTYKGGALELGFTMSWTLSALTLANLAKLTSIKTVPPETRDRLIEAIDGLDGSFRTPAAQGLSPSQGSRPLFLRLASPPKRGRLLEAVEDRRPLWRHGGRLSERGRVARHFPQGHPEELPGYDGTWAHGHNPQGTEAADRAVASCQPPARIPLVRPTSD